MSDLISIGDFLKEREEKRIQKIADKKIVYIDMDNVIVDFKSAFKHYDEIFLEQTEHKDEIEGIFYKMEPMKDAIKSVKLLSKHFSVFILSTAPWENQSAWSDKLNWIKKYLPKECYKRLILSHNKQLQIGDYLIDDRIFNGAIGFKGELIQFGNNEFPNWRQITEYILRKEILKNEQ